MALLHRAGQPGRWPRRRCFGRSFRKVRGGKLGGRILGNGRRRHGVGFGRLRCRIRPAAGRRRQWQPVEPSRAVGRQGRQSVPVLDPFARSGHRRLQVALPAQPGGNLGFHRHPADHPCRSRDRGRTAQGAAAGAQERFLLCYRPQRREAHQRRALCPAELGRAASRPGARSRSRVCATRTNPS